MSDTELNIEQRVPTPVLEDPSKVKTESTNVQSPVPPIPPRPITQHLSSTTITEAIKRQELQNSVTRTEDDVVERVENADAKVVEDAVIVSQVTESPVEESSDAPATVSQVTESTVEESSDVPATEEVSPTDESTTEPAVDGTPAVPVTDDGYTTAEVQIEHDDLMSSLQPEPVKVETPPNPYDEVGAVAAITTKQAEEMLVNTLGFKEDSNYAGPRKFDNVELNEVIDMSTQHFKIIESVALKDVGKLKLEGVNVSKPVIITRKDKPDFDLQQLKIERNAVSGERKVQVVAVQSGYSCMVSPMRSRELRTFGREVRSTDTYSYKMSIYSALFHKLSDFSIGKITFEQFVNITAWPDVQTLIFGLYHATFATINTFNVTCYNCGEVSAVPIRNNTLIAVPPGDVTMATIRDVINGSKDPKELVSESKRWSGVDIYIRNNIKFFRVRTPSIAEFLDRAYKNKRQEVIDDNGTDMYYSGYVLGVGTLDVEEYLNTGKTMYYYDNTIESIDREIANLDPDEKVIFDKAMMEYINRNSISYQVPKVKCPHCNHISTQRELNMESLFFEIRGQKGML